MDSATDSATAKTPLQTNVSQAVLTCAPRRIRAGGVNIIKGGGVDSVWRSGGVPLCEVVEF